MNIAIEAEPAPLRVDEHGAIRVGGSRVLLELVIHAFEDGATPEAIVQMYDSLTLADTYGAITYYLRHPETVAEYLAEVERGAEEIRAKIEAEQKTNSEEFWRRLQARREAAGGGTAAPAQ